MTITKVKSRYCVKCEALYKYQCKCPNNKRMFNIRETFHEIADERVNESCNYLGIKLIKGKPKMKTFKEMIESVSTSKYSKLWKIINKSKLFDKKDKKQVYELVVDEYLDMGDDPNDASEQDAVEIADASGIDIAEMTANQKAYREFFDKKLSKWKVKSPAELSDEDKKKFYNEIEKEWDKDKD